jgi:hypothetical protein
VSETKSCDLKKNDTASLMEKCVSVTLNPKQAFYLCVCALVKSLTDFLSIRQGHIQRLHPAHVRIIATK